MLCSASCSRDNLHIDCPFLFRLLVECFSKYDLMTEAVRHFRALAKHPGATVYLFNEGDGRETDPLSLYLRALCLEGIHLHIVSGKRLSQSLNTKEIIWNLFSIYVDFGSAGIRTRP